MLNATQTPMPFTGPAKLIAAAGLLALLTVGGCGGTDRSDGVYPSLDSESRMSVLKAQDRQRAMGVQIESLRTKDNALDLCFEMCHRGGESCSLSQELCQYSKKFPKAIALVATCRYSREQCRRHRRTVPRQCNCIWEEGS